MDHQIWSFLYISSGRRDAQPNSFGEGFVQEVFLIKAIMSKFQVTIIYDPGRHFTVLFLLLFL